MSAIQSWVDGARTARELVIDFDLNKKKILNLRSTAIFSLAGLHGRRDAVAGARMTYG
jgi:hypothetical protein